MVTVVQLHPQNSAAALGPLAEGLAAAEQALLGRALEFAEPMYAGQLLSTGGPPGCCSPLPSTSAASMPCASASARRSPALPPASRSSTSYASRRAATRT